MPTENRSSNTEMVSEPFQREERYVVIKVSKMHPHPAFRAKHLSALKREHEDALVDCVVVERDWPEYEPTWAAIEARVTGQPAPQPHPEPIAWMVGTAFWWTKEEAERDAAETGLPIVGLGPMTNAAEVERLREALKFYADRDHFAEDIGSDWDSVSGEPANVLWHENEAWFVEDGSIARAALERRPEKKSF
ncbi:hypothetical protein [Pseudomonas sp. USTB-Z]|uniref:hypothetical protein n=1 Tax=Pseudomonas sp. USTB-Z TaxID=2794351 RepID=UPI002180D802|nr:hypothetical protein [Pseudomonas sp. USTB-Z]